MQKMYSKSTTIVIAIFFVIGATMIPMLSNEVMAQYAPSQNNGGSNSHINNGGINSYLARDPPGNIFDIPTGAQGVYSQGVPGHTISGPDAYSQVGPGQGGILGLGNGGTIVLSQVAPGLAATYPGEAATLAPGQVGKDDGEIQEVLEELIIGQDNILPDVSEQTIAILPDVSEQTIAILPDVDE